MTHTVRKFTLTAIFLILIFFSPQAAAADSAQNHYTLRAFVNYEAAALIADETIEFTNRTGSRLDSVVLKVVPAYFDSFTLFDSHVDGIKVNSALDGVNLEVPLPKTLEPGQKTTISLTFGLEIPQEEGRFGFHSRIMTLGNWFPILTVYRDERLAGEKISPGWEKEPYIPVGDAFFSEIADFEVTLITSVPLTVAHTGSLVEQEGNQWKFRADDVRDFTLALSDRYETSSITVDGIQVTSYYLPGHGEAGAKFLDFAAETIRWMNRRLIPYPYPTLSFAEMGGQSGAIAGMEYPNLILISANVSENPGGIADFPAYLILHETVHQWFYGIVGNDQLHEPWADEAFATWLALDFYRDNHPNLFPSLWNRRIVQVGRPGDESIPVDSSVYDFRDDGRYFDITYRRGALFLEELYQLMGDSDFFSALQEYTRLYKGRVATGTGLLDIMQSKTSQNLNPLIREYFSYSRYRFPEPLRVRLEGVPAGDWQGTVTLTPVADTPIVRIKAIEETGWSMESVGQLSIDTRAWENGDHWLWLQFTDASGRTAETALTFGVKNLAASTPTPEATPVPATPTPTSPAAPQPSPTTQPSPEPEETDQAPESRILGIIIVGGAVIIGISVIVLLAQQGSPRSH